MINDSGRGAFLAFPSDFRVVPSKQCDVEESELCTRFWDFFMSSAISVAVCKKLFASNFAKYKCVGSDFQGSISKDRFSKIL